MNENTDNEFITEHFALVHRIASRFKGRGIEYDELFSAGCVGLVKAGNRFDKSRGLCFSTYAVPVIMGEIKQLFRDGGLIKVSRGIKEQSLKLLRIREEMEKSGEEPTLSALSEKAGISVEEAAIALNSVSPAISIDAEDAGEYKGTDIPVEAPQAVIVEKIALHQSLSRLDPTERKIIWLRYNAEYTQSKTAELMGMSQVQISRQERRILEKLRNELVC